MFQKNQTGVITKRAQSEWPTFIVPNKIPLYVKKRERERTHQNSQVHKNIHFQCSPHWDKILFQTPIYIWNRHDLNQFLYSHNHAYRSKCEWDRNSPSNLVVFICSFIQAMFLTWTETTGWAWASGPCRSWQHTTLIRPGHREAIPPAQDSAQKDSQSSRLEMRLSSSNHSWRGESQPEPTRRPLKGQRWWSLTQANRNKSIFWFYPVMINKSIIFYYIFKDKVISRVKPFSPLAGIQPKFLYPLLMQLNRRFIADVYFNIKMAWENSGNYNILIWLLFSFLQTGFYSLPVFYIIGITAYLTVYAVVLRGYFVFHWYFTLFPNAFHNSHCNIR